MTLETAAGTSTGMDMLRPMACKCFPIRASRSMSSRAPCLATLVLDRTCLRIHRPAIQGRRLVRARAAALETLRDPREVEEGAAEEAVGLTHRARRHRAAIGAEIPSVFRRVSSPILN